jgi:hypothetical protein
MIAHRMLKATRLLVTLLLGELVLEDIVQGARGVGFQVLQLLVDLLVLAGSIVDALTAARRRLLLRTGLALRRRRLTTFRHDFWCGFLFLVEKALGEV